MTPDFSIIKDPKMILLRETYQFSARKNLTPVFPRHEMISETLPYQVEFQFRQGLAGRKMSEKKRLALFFVQEQQTPLDVRKYRIQVVPEPLFDRVDQNHR